MKKIIYLIALTFLLLVGCSQSIEKEIIGTWENIEDSEYVCDSKIEDEKVAFDDDGIIIGVTDFKNYKIKESDNKDYQYAVLTGDYNNTMRFKMKIEDEKLLMVDKDDEEGFDSSTACYMEKVSD